MDWDRIEGSWDLFKGRVLKKWRRLTDEDLEAIAGRRDRLESKIHERYGFAEEHIRKAVDDWSRWQTFEIRPERSPLALVKRGGKNRLGIGVPPSRHSMIHARSEASSRRTK
jgi:uncharacterized protein YjbJ (UPF0337 family)